MNLLVVCPHLRPDVAPTGEVMSSILDGMVERGHRIDVVTSLPWYRDHAVDPAWRGRMVRTERTGWGAVTRVHPFPTDKTNIPARALAFAGFTAMAGGLAVGRRGPYDGVLAMSPPLTLGLPGWVAARRFRAPFVFNIQDVFPDVAVELGVLTGARVIAAAAGLERFLYRRADAVTVLSEDLRANVAAKLGRSGPVRVIPNFVDTAWIRPGDRHNPYRREFDLGDRVVVMYAGNVGFSQNLDLFIEAAQALADDPDIVFVVNGGGAARPELEQAARGLANVRFVDMQPKERLPEVLAAADIHVVPLRQGLARASVPSKLYSILAAGRPVVASVDAGTEVARVLDESGAGIAVPPDDAETFTKAIASLAADRDHARRLGESGRVFVEGWLSPAAVAERYEALFAELALGRSRVDGRPR